jgi:DNA primase
MNLTIADVLEHYGADLTRVLDYGWRKVCCPFHDDKIASASVNLGTGAFACHACNVHGDVLSTIARAEGFGTVQEPDRKAANEWADRIFGKSMPGISRPVDEPKKSTWRARLFE